MPNQMLKCAYCGTPNTVRLTPSDLDYEGNNQSTRLKQRRTSNQALEFTCKACNKKNTIKR